MSPRALLHLEGAAVFLLSLWTYFSRGGTWWLFVLLLLAPDLFAVGYVAGPRIGSGIDSVTKIRRERTGRKPSSPSETLPPAATAL